MKGNRSIFKGLIMFNDDIGNRTEAGKWCRTKLALTNAFAQTDKNFSYFNPHIPRIHRLLG